MTKSMINGINSLVEITNISKFGIWLYDSGKEYFLSYENFPWFKKATIDEILDVQKNNKHYYWEKLDIDLSIDIIENPDNYPLIANQ